ncbi:hypothetical protein LGZ99_04805 [Photorhabdus temperata]|uniref:Baseplate protein J-like domain-containing protein n=1 Tax=Photorhabdus temperata subsp. temperata Meg1 TaxID=1393735 RepID=A0A081S1J7_PHOTE|nr:hypothetical protein [Photorhabdus temperata]KER04800.1 hypothetical protein MEG1DRAFT_00586 [Photorhabdus temperata subsp. temperata Meg1]MCT8346551.1 hypothetical protein [Photorhabdus temperata]
MGLSELKNKLATIVPETEFKLDERSTLDILNWLQEYAKKIPFDQEKKQFWDSFYFIQENSPEKLADLYQNINKANGHLPAHQAFVLAFLKLLETSKVLFNTFPARHRDLYYRELLGLKPRSAQADSVALGITLNTDNAEYLIPKGTLFDAGQDSAGNPLQYASDTDLLTNQGKLTDLRWHRKDNDGWKSAILLSASDNIELPENGIRLFSETSNDIEVHSGRLSWGKIETDISSLANTFYLGFTDVLPGQTLSLYWQLEGSRKLPLSWFYLNKNNNWSPLDKLIDDKTRNLFDRGTWRTLLPHDASNQTSQMPKGRFWLKAQTPLIRNLLTKTNKGKLTDLYWYRKDNGSWQSAMPLNLSNDIKLPTNGIQIFSPTSNDASVLSGYLITTSSFAMSSGKLIIKATLASKWGGDPAHITAQISSGDHWLSLSAKVNDKIIELSLLSSDAPVTPPDALDNMKFKEPVLKLGTFQGSILPKIEGIEISIDDRSNVLSIDHFSVYPLMPFGWGNKDSEVSSLTNGEFYLGFTGVLPGDTLSLCWHLEGSKKPALSWSYLSNNNTWESLTEPPQSSSNQEIWSTLLPQQASNTASQMPKGRYWLKAQISIEEQAIPIKVASKIEPLDYPKIKGLLYNATTATLINTETVEQDHFINGLPAKNIKQPVNASVAINDVAQPWTSWNGHPKEDEQTFLKRVPARLSHRNRALNWDDIVTLLKEQFISIFDVKYPSTNELTKIPTPENRQLIVIPGNRYKDNDDSLRPELNQARLTEMVELLDRLSSPWTTIEIKNPTYVNVLIHYELIFASDVNPDYGRHQLQQELSRKYMPWEENTAIGVTLGNHIDYYQLLASIQQSPLVERVTNLTLKKDNQPTVSENIEATDDEVLILVWHKNP